MKHNLTAKGGDLYLDGEKFLLLAGEIPYFRIHPTEWRDRLELARDFGLNTIQSYCPWNLHEPQKGVFNFEGMLDLGKFLALCDEMGFYPSAAYTGNRSPFITFTIGIYDCVCNIDCSAGTPACCTNGCSETIVRIRIYCDV